MTDALARLTARSPRRLLDELAARAQKAAAAGKDRPLVTVHLATGRDLVGRIVAVGDDGGIAVLALFVGGTLATPQVAHVRVDQVVAVTHDPVAPRPASEDPPPGRLEIARALGERAAGLASRLARPVELVAADGLGDDERRAVMAAIPIAAAVLGRLADDAMGREALAAVTTVRLGAATHGSVRRDGATLTIEVPRAPDDAWDEAAMRAAVEKVL